MIFRSFVILTFFIVKIICTNINGKNYNIYHSTENEVSTRVIYPENGSFQWTARSVYNKTYLTTGWDTFDIETNPDVDDTEQAFLAGYLEGMETNVAIYDHFRNIVEYSCENESAVCEKVNNFLDINTQWIKGMVGKYAANDMYWHQVNLFYQQLAGLTLGYNSAAPPEKKLTFRNIMWMNFNWDIDELKDVFKNVTNKATFENSHCSALIKILHGQSDILVSHNSWSGYETMRRIIKRYSLHFKNVASTSISFSGYPGLLVSGDDFYILNSGLVALETSNSNNNATLWSYVQPVEQVLEVVRVTVANRLADAGRAWAKIFSDFNSGTYNNQWMIVDMKKFSPGLVKPELLWVLEQIPGYIHRADQTDTLLRQGYWASYNRPFYPDIFKLTGYPPLVEKYGSFFTYENTSRALIFKRDQEKVTDIHSMMHLMRSNDFQHDPLSRCNCTPPYSSVNSIASRNDLNPINGKYPFKILGHQSNGALDAKVVSFQLAKTLSFWAVNGPTTGAHLPPFQWSKSDFNHKLPHYGHPDLFNFKPVHISWPNQDRATASVY